MPRANNAAQLRRQLKVILRPEQVIVTKIRGQPRETLLDVDALTVPLGEPIDCKAMASIVGSRPDATSARFHACLS